MALGWHHQPGWDRDEVIVNWLLFTGESFALKKAEVIAS